MRYYDTMSELHPFLAAAKLHARIDGNDEDEALSLMLEAATADVLGAAGIRAPEDLETLSDDLRLAICDQAAMLYDERGPATERDRPRGLSLAASRIVARHRGVSAGITWGA